MLLAVATLIAVVGIALVAAALRALGRARLFSFVARAAFAAIFLAVGGGLVVLALGLAGVRALTHEEVAARVSLKPTGPQRFEATVGFADGRVETYDLFGDEVYIDGHILKWEPILNFLGLHTSYRLDRIGGRYRSVAQEVVARRTIYPPSPPRFIDLVALRRNAPLVTSEFVDAEYGSATFVPVDGPTELEVRVSTTGLMVRPAPAR